MGILDLFRGKRRTHAQAQRPSAQQRPTTPVMSASSASSAAPASPFSSGPSPKMTPQPMLGQQDLERVDAIIGPVEGHHLSAEQLSAIAGAGRNTLVLAGAGTGKTTTIGGYVTWLLATGRARADEILVLSYTKASADEMAGRILGQTGMPVRACTFHSLGLEICRSSTVAELPVADGPHMRAVVQQAFDRHMNDDERYLRTALSMMPRAVRERYEADRKAERTNDAAHDAAGPRRDYAYSRYYEHLLDTAQTVIQHMRANALGVDDMRRINGRRGGEHFGRNREMLYLIEPLYRAYLEHLRATRSIDFAGMIARAVRCVESGAYRHHYRYVLIDEYQDLSRPRYELVRALREQRDFALFCVGDDWQSIYRFAGSDIRFVLDFPHVWGRWGGARMFRIETTRRFKRSLIEASGRFVMADGHLYDKRLHAVNTTNDHSLKALGGDTDEERLDAITTQLGKLPKNADVLFLGRYRSDRNLLFPQRPGPGRAPFAEADGGRIVFADRSDLTIRFRTVHAAKGLQSDFTFLLCCSGGLRGFPSAIPEEPLLGLILPEVGDYPYAEERRLFYVAMTRCRKKLFLVVDRRRPSRFMYELHDTICPNIFRGVRLPPRCPYCGEALTLRSGGRRGPDGRSPGGRFYGCTAWPRCSYTRPARV